MKQYAIQKHQVSDTMCVVASKDYYLVNKHAYNLHSVFVRTRCFTYINKQVRISNNV